MLFGAYGGKVQGVVLKVFRSFQVRVADYSYTYDVSLPWFSHNVASATEARHIEIDSKYQHVS